ncbi:MAG: alpha-ketoacid dehydrogenase subunit alpha/beta [Saccharofermentanales bacterium]
MTKSLPIIPEEARAPRMIELQDIPVNQYQKTVKDEKDNFTKDELMGIYRDMRLIREFEEMLYSIKTTSSYHGLEYFNPGPSHLSLGEEAVAVGQAYYLDKNDFIFGTHRSHNEVLAKSFSAIRKMEDAELLEIMETFMDGRQLKAIESLRTEQMSIKELALIYILYGFLAEIFAKKTGFNQGLGGSMHCYFVPFGIYPNNAIVGGSAGIALGAALYKKINRQPGLVVANVGDGALGCGPVWEALAMSTMDQYKTLWEGDMKGGLPLIFNVNNNHYGMGGQTRGETMGYGNPARIGAALNAEQMYAETVDGNNPLAVIDAYKRKMKNIDQKEGPVFVEFVTYRYHHAIPDPGTYRTDEELDAWKEHDPIKTFPAQLIEAGIATQAEIDLIDEDVVNKMIDVTRLAVDSEISPRINLKEEPRAIADVMFSNQRILKLSDAEPDMLQTKEELKDNVRVKQISRRERFAYDEKGEEYSVNKRYQLRDGIFEAVLDKFYEDPTLIAYGEDLRDWGGAYACYRGLTEAVPYHRLFNSPISEAAIVASAIGYAMAGGRAIVELMYCDFLGRAGDEVFNQLPKWQAMSGGYLKMPVVIRMSVGSRYGAQHSQEWTSLVAHIPGIKVIYPVTPYDAKGMLTSALNGTDPVVVFESQDYYDVGEKFVEGGVPEESYEVPLGEPAVRRKGSDVTFLTIGTTLYRALEAAEELQEKYNISAEVIDARTLVPFNYEKVIESVKKTGKIIVAGDATEKGSFLKEFAANIQDMAFDYLDAPVQVLGAHNWITPAREFEKDFFPQKDWFIDIYHQRIEPIQGYTPINNFTEGEMLRRRTLGV